MRNGLKFGEEIEQASGEKYTWVGRRENFVLFEDIGEKYLNEEPEKCPIIRLDRMNLPFCRSKGKLSDSPGGPAVRTPRFQCRGRGFDPQSGAEMPCGAANTTTNKKTR